MVRTKFRLSDSSDCRGLKQFPATNMHKQTIVLINCVDIVTSPHNQDAAQRLASPFATKHKVHLKSKAILKSFSYHRTLNIPEVSHFLNEFGRHSCCSTDF